MHIIINHMHISYAHAHVLLTSAAEAPGIVANSTSADDSNCNFIIVVQIMALLLQASINIIICLINNIFSFLTPLKMPRVERLSSLIHHQTQYLFSRAACRKPKRSSIGDSDSKMAQRLTKRTHKSLLTIP